MQPSFLPFLPILPVIPTNPTNPTSHSYQSYQSYQSVLPILLPQSEILPSYTPTKCPITLSAKSARIRTQHLRAVQQRAAGAEREAILQREVEEMKRARDLALEAVADLRAQRNAWAEFARIVEEAREGLGSHVAKLKEMDREKDNVISALRIQTSASTPRSTTSRTPSPTPTKTRCSRLDAAFPDSDSETAAIDIDIGSNSPLDLDFDLDIDIDIDSDLNLNLDFDLDFDFDDKKCAAPTNDGGLAVHIRRRTFMVGVRVQSVSEEACHLFHRKCLEPLVDATKGCLLCPLCRKSVMARFGSTCIREVYFTSAPQSHAQQEKEAALQKEIEDAKRDKATALKQVAGLRSERDKWVAHALALAEEKKLLYRELEELDTLREECNSLKRTIRVLRQDTIDLKAPKLIDLRPALSSDFSTTSSVGKSPSILEIVDRPASIQHQPNPKSLFALPAESAVSNRARRQRVYRDPLTTIPLSSSCAPASQSSTNTSVFTFRSAIQSTNKQPTEASKPTKDAKQPIKAKTRQYQTGAAILWRGYGCPQKTAVLECTATDGYHCFSGKGTNQYKKRYTCTICGVIVSE
ncbi:hypothetical protein BDN70DRAFT_937260 [Pholiota conissans]|uniref:Uncharacterized protein n=1 Tax=Pholiota conissans TaxID=109636 RepID=A0A9P5YQL6_9AGAR|nr:hypothetical protein BDN70DRAFT_937260 [Pholiota conissans]